jgi:hypothetical protein
MGIDTAAITEQVSTVPMVKYIFIGLLALLLVIAVGHLYAVTGLTTLYLGLPLWIWLQLGVVTIMLGIAWIAVRLVTMATDRGV